MSAVFVVIFFIALLALVIYIIAESAIMCSYKNTAFESSITGIFEIKVDGKNAEIVLRDLISYVQRNEIRCFKKIYIKLCSNDEQTYYICKKICEKYPLFEILEICL